MADSEQLVNAARGFIEIFSQTLEQNNQDHFSRALKEIETATVQRGPLPRLKHTTLNYLDSLSANVSNEKMCTAVLSLDWGQVYQGGGIDPDLAEGMFAAQTAGTYGVFAAEHCATGLFLLAPNVCYPLHTHAAREVYHCLAGELDITHCLDEPSFTLRANQFSETPSGRLHSLRTRAKPVLLAYIWTGDIGAPTWWWDQDENGNWIRTAWKRKPGESWKVAHKESVDELEFNNAVGVTL